MAPLPNSNFQAFYISITVLDIIRQAFCYYIIIYRRQFAKLQQLANEVYVKRGLPSLAVRDATAIVMQYRCQRP